MTASRAEKMVSIFANACRISYSHVQPIISTPSLGEICICKGNHLFFSMFAHAKLVAFVRF